MMSDFAYDPVTAIDESAAAGDTALIFAEIRRTMDIPLVRGRNLLRTGPLRGRELLLSVGEGDSPLLRGDGRVGSGRRRGRRLLLCGALRLQHRRDAGDCGDGDERQGTAGQVHVPAGFDGQRPPRGPGAR